MPIPVTPAIVYDLKKIVGVGPVHNVFTELFRCDVKA